AGRLNCKSATIPTFSLFKIPLDSLTDVMQPSDVHLRLGVTGFSQWKAMFIGFLKSARFDQILEGCRQRASWIDAHRPCPLVRARNISSGVDCSILPDLKTSRRSKAYAMRHRSFCTPHAAKIACR